MYLIICFQNILSKQDHRKNRQIHQQCKLLKTVPLTKERFKLIFNKFKIISLLISVGISREKSTKEDFNNSIYKHMGNILKN